MSRLEVEVFPARDATTDAKLEAFFDACPTSFAQQTVGWREVITGIGHDEPIFFGCCRRGRLIGVLPAYRFAGPLGAILTSVPQAGPLGGVASLPGLDLAPIYNALLTTFVEEAVRRDCVLASVMTNPFWPDRDLYDSHLKPDYVLENTCQVLDLHSAFDANGRPSAGSNHLHRNLRKAQSGELWIDEEQTLTNVDEWYGLHHERHREIGATPLPYALFAGALEHLVPRNKGRFFFVRLTESGEMVAGGLYLYHGSVMDALMSSVRSARAKLAPNYLLALHSMRFALGNGVRFYNWQASPPNGGVHRFKRQWGGRDAEYYYLTRVTGDVKPILESEVKAISEAYRWHYVLPFDRIGGARAATAGPSTRASSWRALQASGIGNGGGRKEPDAHAITAGLQRRVVDHYERQLRRHGPTARGMDWKDEASQRQRFAVLCAVYDLSGLSVHDVGAGAGHLYDFLRERGVACQYSGSDLSADMVRAARHRHQDVSFRRQDILCEPAAMKYDVVLCSGIFHVRLESPEAAWRDFVRQMTKQMFCMCRVAIAFNCLTDQVDFRAEKLFYANPGEMLEFCRRNLSRFVVLRHDYPLHEFTIYVYREPPGALGGPI